MMNKEKLLPCPLCGGEAVLQTVESHTHILKHAVPDCTGEAYIECTRCGCGIIRDTELEPIQLWNKRKGQQSNGWISSTGRLPEEPHKIPINTDEVESMIENGDLQEYIVTIYGGKSATTLYYVGDGNWYDVLTQEYYDVVAWQPLPEPYKQKTIYIPNEDASEMEAYNGRNK